MTESSKLENEAQWVAAAQAGDQQAFKRLFNHHYSRVYRTVFGVLRHEDNAQEVTQQVWVKVWKKLDSFQGNSAFSTWLYRIATFAALDFVRANKKHQKLDSIDASEQDDEIKTIQLTSDNIDENPVASLKSAEIMERFQMAIEKLNENHRTALVLREIEGLSYEEIADIMNCKIGTVMSRIFNARKAIQKDLEEFK